ncbi:MAG: hypothetical protein E6J90_40765, partial [Deltaproteobacteria bacterium]
MRPPERPDPERRAAPPTGPTVDAPSWQEPGPTGDPASAATVVAVATPDAPIARGSSALPTATLRRIEQFLLLERIGAGGMGEV